MYTLFLELTIFEWKLITSHYFVCRSIRKPAHYIYTYIALILCRIETRPTSTINSALWIFNHIFEIFPISMLIFNKYKFWNVFPPAPAHRARQAGRPAPHHLPSSGRAATPPTPRWVPQSLSRPPPAPPPHLNPYLTCRIDVYKIS